MSRLLINVDSTIQPADRGPEFLPAGAAARILGVKRATLYAYASRGLLTRVPLGGGRASGYLRADVERLKARAEARAGHGAVAAAALRWGEPVLDTSVSAITPDGPRYRGLAAVDLAGDGVSFERAAQLLWSGQLEEGGRSWGPARLSRHASEALRLVRPATPLATLVLLVSIFAAGEVDARRRNREPNGEPTEEQQRRRARALVSRLAAGALEPPARDRSLAASLLASLGATAPRRGAVAAIDQALVLMADHELNASTFAARVAASAGAGLWASVSAALATLSGSRHGGECDRAEALIEEVASERRAERVIRGRVREGRRVPGFGHPLYPAGDPRARPLLDAARALDPRGTRLVDAIIAAGEHALEIPVNVDLGLTALARAAGVRPGGATVIFAVGRSAGWIAHVFEQRAAGYLLRPRARYVARS